MELAALIHRAKFAARRDAFKLIMGGRKDKPRPATLKSEFNPYRRKKKREAGFLRPKVEGPGSRSPPPFQTNIRP
jgi:hypothetical protein